MILTKVKNKISGFFKAVGYSRAAGELLKLTDKQLEEVGISRKLLEEGYSAFPWREEAKNQINTDNVSSIQSTLNDVDTLVKTRRPRAA